MWPWLNNNAPAIQALATLLSLAVTAILCVVTWRYVQLTRSIADTMRRQLSAQMQPVVEIRIVKLDIVAPTDDTVGLTIRYHFKNRGAQPIKIRNVMLVLRIITGPNRSLESRSPISRRENLVLMPEQEETQDLTCHQRFQSNARGVHNVTIIVNCTDMAGLTEHSFWFDPQGGLRHSSGFEMERSLGSRFKEALTRIMKKLEMLGEMDDALYRPPRDR